LLKISRMHVQELATVCGWSSSGWPSAANRRRRKSTRRSPVQQLRGAGETEKDQVEALKVRAGTSGVLQQVAVQVANR